VPSGGVEEKKMHRRSGLPKPGKENVKLEKTAPRKKGGLRTGGRTRTAVQKGFLWKIDGAQGGKVKPNGSGTARGRLSS